MIKKAENQDMFEFERALMKKGVSLIAGIDEAGRGPLAGPVAAACCIPCLTDPVEGVNDSKKLTPLKRARLFERIKESAIAYKIVFIEPEVIDEINILEATKLAMREALAGVFPIPEHVLIDAVKQELNVPYTALIHGDARSHSIAAASILAKVARDELMTEYAKLYPEYGFEKHKGYGSEAHIEAIKKYGPCPIHRRSFLKNILPESDIGFGSKK